MRDEKSKKVLVFGTFDGIHDGHRYFLAEAKKFGSELVVCVSQDETVKKLKGHLPYSDLNRRIEMLKKEKIADKIIGGDKEIKTWEVVLNEKPDVICLGYDQNELKKSLEEALPRLNAKFKIVVVQDYKGDELHNSLLHKK